MSTLTATTVNATTLKANTIQDSNAVAKNTINVYEQWTYETQDTTLSNGSDLTTWNIDNRTGIGSLNAGMSHSSGVWTFPSTGTWLVEIMATMYTSGAARTYVGPTMFLSTDTGSNYTGMQYIYMNGYQSGAHGSVFYKCILNVANVSTYRMKYQNTSQGNAVYRGGGTSGTKAFFQKIG